VSDQDRVRTALTSTAYETIKRQVIDLHLRPGEIIMVQSVAQAMGISRTPVREALVRLTVEGLVEHAEGRKFRVTEVTQEAIREIYDIRQALEGYSIAEVAPRIRAEEIARLERLYGQMQKALEEKAHDRFMALDLEFHNGILAMHGNRSLTRIVEQMNDRVQRIRYLTISIPGRLESTIREHSEILASLRARDGEGARAALCRHMAQARADLEQLFTHHRKTQFEVSLITAGLTT
jgi:GntR family transcriptional regulator, rspAB operon transcriptional repressor